jgi:transposase InsO family protein
MRFAFIDAEKAHYPVTVLCRVLQVRRSGFYAWLRRTPGLRLRHDRVLAVHIGTAFRDSRGTYGSPRVQAELAAKGLHTSKRRVERLMRDKGLCALRKRRFTRTTDSRHRLPLAPNLLARDFTASAPNRVWTTDVTYIWTLQGWLYLAVILDLYSRRVVGWAMSASNDDRLALSALHMALQTRRPPRGLIHHSDRGSPYCSKDYRAVLQTHGVVRSMSRKGDCWDNAVSESFFGTLKQELLYRCELQTRAKTQTAVFEYLEVYYNPKRRHSTLGFLSPIAYEERTSGADSRM